MQKLLAYLVAMVFLGTGAMLFQHDGSAHSSQSIEVQMASDAAFRDGVYLGKLARNTKNSTHPPVGRWSTEKDRASFVEGYRLGLSQQ